MSEEYAKKHPVLAKSLGYGVTIAGGALVVGGGALALGTAGLGTAGLSALYSGALTMFKKASHYNTEHKNYLQEQALDLDTQKTERGRIINAVAGKKRYDKLNPLGRKDLRTHEYYIKTSHDQLADVATLNTDLTALVAEQGTLRFAQTDALRKATLGALARLSYYKETGQNFLGTNDRTKSEEQYATLQRLMQAGAERLGLNLKDPNITNDPDYRTTLAQIKNGSTTEQGYDRAHSKLTSNRRRSAGLGAAKAAGIAFGTSIVASSVADTVRHRSD